MKTKLILIGGMFALILVFSILFISAKDAPDNAELVLVGLNASEFAQVYVTPDVNQTYMGEYIEIYSNLYDNLTYNVMNNSDNEISTVLRFGGPYVDEILGININGLKYAIHLILCDDETNACIFRINGAPTNRVYNASLGNESNIFVVNDDFNLVVNSIKFRECGDVFFCDIRYEAYDFVNVSLVRR